MLYQNLTKEQQNIEKALDTISKRDYLKLLTKLWQLSLNEKFSFIKLEGPSFIISAKFSKLNHFANISQWINLVEFSDEEKQSIIEIVNLSKDCRERNAPPAKRINKFIIDDHITFKDQKIKPQNILNSTTFDEIQTIIDKILFDEILPKQSKKQGMKI